MCEVNRQWLDEFSTEPPIQLTDARNHDRFEASGTAHNVHRLRCGKPYMTVKPVSSAVVLEQFAQSPQKSARQELAEQVCNMWSMLNGNFISQGCYMPWMKMFLIEVCSFVSGFNTRYLRMSTWAKLFSILK
jgi:hypothetical protein